MFSSPIAGMCNTSLSILADNAVWCSAEVLFVQYGDYRLAWRSASYNGRKRPYIF
jgi:hypothetical protein